MKPGVADGGRLFNYYDYLTRLGAFNVFSRRLSETRGAVPPSHGPVHNELHLAAASLRPSCQPSTRGDTYKLTALSVGKAWADDNVDIMNSSSELYRRTGAGSWKAQLFFVFFKNGFMPVSKL